MTIGSVVSALVIGLVVGALGRLAVPGRQRIGLLLTVAVGIIAALVGTALARSVGVANTAGADWIELAFQVGLAAVGVALVATTMRPRRRARRVRR
jgi:uncharacterized membrane protein YeaQ/YmgE (transglycosylase-associated protein family)